MSTPGLGRLHLVQLELLAPKGATRDGDQLEMFVPRWVQQEPWSGKSPRVLTRASQLFSLGAAPAGGLRDLR